MIKSVSAELLPLYDELEIISEEFAAKEHGYRHSSYLVKIAAETVACGFKFVPFLLDAGNGKSFIAIMLAEYHARAGKSTCILVHNKVLQK